MTTSSFTEKQNFTQKWLIVILFFVLFLTIAIAILVLVTKQAGVLVAFSPLLFALTILIFFRTASLQLCLTEDRVSYRFFPFQISLRHIFKSEISSVSVVRYNPLEDFGGWGIRYGKKGKAYTVKGNDGIFIKLTNNKNILIGTSKPQEIKQCLQKFGYTMNF